MNRIVFKLIVALAIILSFFEIAAANPPKPPPVGDIAGYVTGLDGETPIQGVAVRAIDPYGFTYYDTTNSDGYYFLYALQLGLYDVETSKAGYITQIQENIEVIMDQVTIVNFQLGFACDYVVGDVNNSGMLNGLDIVYAVNYFKGFSPPPYSCFCDGHIWYVSGDVNGDCLFNGLDVVYIIVFLKGGAPPIPCPACPPGGR